MLVGQIGNFAGLSNLEPPLNLTALLRCGQVGYRLCPEPWIGESAATNPQAFRFPVWEFNWPGAYQLEDGRPVRARAARAAGRRHVEPVSVDLSSRLSRHRRDAGADCRARGLRADVDVRCADAARSGRTFTRTVKQLRLPIVTIAFILSIATVMNYSGMTSSMALALARTGVLFPFFAAFLGMIGVFLTGSDTSSNTLFGPLQATTARISGLDPVLMGATNASAGVMGKMISPQNLSVGAAGVGAVGREGEILVRVVVHSLILTTLMGVLAMLQAYVFTWMVPEL